jgi:hypothetical protein
MNPVHARVMRWAERNRQEMRVGASSCAVPFTNVMDLGRGLVISKAAAQSAAKSGYARQVAGFCGLHTTVAFPANQLLRTTISSAESRYFKWTFLCPTEIGRASSAKRPDGRR